MATNGNKTVKRRFRISAMLVLICCFVLAVLLFKFVFGNPENFLNNDPNNHPLTGNLLGTIYKGGVIVPIIQTMLLTVLVLSIERFFAIRKSQGKKNLTDFVGRLKDSLTAGNLDQAKALCDGQEGVVANVVNAGLVKYAQMAGETGLTRQQRSTIIQKEIEEATTLELPSLEQNLPVLATMTTLGTLMGLLGTVIGMIRSFAALANAGSPDSIALSTGISEALVNTAFGIMTGALAVISYNYFTTKIDGITNAIDEVGFTMVQTFSKVTK